MKKTKPNKSLPQTRKRAREPRSGHDNRDPDPQTRRGPRRTQPRRQGSRSYHERASLQVSEARVSERVNRVCMFFGIDAKPKRVVNTHAGQLRFQPGTITLISGPSGSGKSTLLKAVMCGHASARVVSDAALAPERAIIDCIGAGGEFPTTVRHLVACALGEPRLWLRTVDELSDGERFRASLAHALESCHRAGRQGLLICDEFCSGVHEQAAKAISHNLRKLVSRHQLAAVVASIHTSYLPDLQPDRHIQLKHYDDIHVSTHTPRPKALSLRRRLAIRRGGKQDYLAFAGMHYRGRDGLGFVDRIFVLQDRYTQENLGIVVYAYAPLELHLRNVTLNNRFKRQPRRLNRQLRIIRRLVIHPDVRGCGLGHYLVAKTLHRAGVRYVECLAAMGMVNPVFEKSGMRRIGTCPVPDGRHRHLAALEQLGVDPFDHDFVEQVCRRPSVRRVVAQQVLQWYRATTSDGYQRVKRQTPAFLAHTFRSLVATRPVYYLWDRQQASAA